jgi:hypothetical protein
LLSRAAGVRLGFALVEHNDDDEGDCEADVEGETGADEDGDAGDGNGCVLMRGTMKGK